MEHKKFIEFLEQHCELEHDRAPTNAAFRDAKEPEEIYREGQLFSITKKNNPTHVLKIKNLKHAHRACEDCGKICQDRRVMSRIMFSPMAHWRKSCTVCNLTQHPDTKQFEISNAYVNMFFYEYFKARDK